MNVKFFSIILVMLISNALIGQTGYFMRSEIETAANGFNNGKTTMTVSTYVKGEDMKIETINKTSTQLQYYIGDKVTVITKEKNADNVCGEGTRDEMKDIIKESDKTEYKDLKVEKTNKTETILGYECKKAIIKYKIAVMGFEMKMENVLWYTDKISLGNDISTGDASNIGVSNAYVDAVKALGGITLKQESNSNGTSLAVMKVMQIEKKEIAESVFAIDAKDCKKMLTLKEQKDKIEERNSARDRQNMQFQQQMRKN